MDTVGAKEWAASKYSSARDIKSVERSSCGVGWFDGAIFIDLFDAGPVACLLRDAGE